jgi:hypothetical protein
MNWKTTVSKLNAKHYSFPAGWDTRDTIAAQLECSPDRVDTLLGPGLKSGEIEKQQFPVWDGRLHRKILVWGYRQRSANEIIKPPAKKSTPPAATGPINAELRTAVLAAHKRHPHIPGRRLREYLPPRLRRASTGDQVLEILAKA